MNNLFDIKRFGKYFVYDLNNLRKRFGISMVILAFMPLIQYFFIGFIKMLAEQSTWYVDPKACTIASVLTSLFVLMLTFPGKTYGFLTEKNAGSTWITLPSSTFEKFISMMLISLILVPFIVLAGNYLSLALLSAFDGNFTNSFHVFLSQPVDWSDSDLVLTGNGVPLAIVAITQGILEFLLGALFFKKSKVAKTILVGFALQTLFSVIVLLFAKANIIDGDLVVETLGQLNPEKFMNVVNVYINVALIIWYALLLGGIYWRLKTIKH